jgi:hypothetical protein
MASEAIASGFHFDGRPPRFFGLRRGIGRSPLIEGFEGFE